MNMILHSVLEEPPKRIHSSFIIQHISDQFVAGDMEKMPLPDATFDVVISNGAFCLAPDKEKAFREVFRVLKPGGR